MVERAFMASWELGQGQIPSLGERVEHRGLLYHHSPPYHHGRGGGCDDDDCNDDDGVDAGTMNKTNSIYEPHNMRLMIKTSGAETMVV